MKFFNLLILLGLIIPIFNQQFSIVGVIYNLAMIISGSIIILTNKRSIKVFLLFLLLFYFIISLFFTVNISSTLNDLFRLIYICIIILVSLQSELKVQFFEFNKKHYNNIFIIIGVIELFLVIGLFNSNNYIYTGPFESDAYVSFFRSPHTLVYYLMFVSMYIIVLNRIKITPISIVLVLVNFYLVLMTGARTGIVLMLAILYYFIKNILFKNGNNKRYKVYFVIIVAVFSIIITFKLNPALLESIPALSKFFLRTGGSNKSLLSNRDIFWQIILQTFSEFNIGSKLFGKGPEYIYNIIGIWAHNDILNIIIGYGLIGISIYIIYFVVYFRSLNIVFSKLDNYIFITAIIIIAVFNGVYNQTIFATTLYLISIMFYNFPKQSSH